MARGAEAGHVGAGLGDHHVGGQGGDPGDGADQAGRADDLHIERFTIGGPSPQSQRAGDADQDLFDTFQVELASSGQVIDVGPDQSILEAIRAAGVDHPSSCEMGICGTCETKVLAGEIDHRDDLLTETERATGSTMMVCVSRARCPKLVLDA